jgi:plastocyanin
MRNRLKKLLAGVAVAIVFSSGQCLAGSIEARVSDQKARPLKDSVVFAVPKGKSAERQGSDTKTVIDQIDKEFIRFVTPIPVGTAINFPNHDQIRHHVYSFSEAKRFEIPLYTGTPAKPVVFDKPGVVVLGCNIHDWMSAYVFVLDTPYYAVTSEDGAARIEGVPSGEYEIRAWHPSIRQGFTAPSGVLRVSDDGAEKASFTLDISAIRRWRAPTGSAGGYR